MNYFYLKKDGIFKLNQIIDLNYGIKFLVIFLSPLYTFIEDILYIYFIKN